MKSKIAVVLAAFAGSLNVGTAQGITLTFDDLPALSSAPGDCVSVPNGYGGLQWSNMLYLNGVNWPADQSNQDYTTGVVSPSNVALNAFGSPAEISSLAPFCMQSAYFTAVTVEPVQLQVQGSRAGIIIYDTTFTIVTTAPSLLTFDGSAVDRVRFKTSAAVWANNAFYFADWFALDNLTITAVPEPSSFAVSVLGVCLIILRQRKMRQA